jgi:hypothetical protein
MLWHYCTPSSCPVPSTNCPAAAAPLQLFFKMDKTGAGEELLLQDLPHTRGVSLAGFTSDMFMQMCIMAGCDFLKQLQGIGMKTAHSHMRKFKSFVKVCVCVCVGGEQGGVHQRHWPCDLAVARLGACAVLTVKLAQPAWGPWHQDGIAGWLTGC